MIRNSKQTKGSRKDEKPITVSLKESFSKIVHDGRKPMVLMNPMPTPTLVVNVDELTSTKSRVDSAKRGQKSSTASHSRQVSVQNNSRKNSMMLQSKQGSKQKQNRSNSSLARNERSDKGKLSFRIDISSILDKKQPQREEVINKHHFTYHYVIGKGGFGKVWSVELKRNKKNYAMKEMLKTKIIAKKSIGSVMNQRVLLSSLKHPFIVNMNYAFQDRQCLYLVMDLLTGGDLRYHIGRRQRFKESETRFFIACIILGLEYLHSKNIIHRDIKPENLVMDEKGFLRITDLGIARVVKPNNNADTSGTPGYMAPQVMCKQDHSFPVDYYAVGVIAYEFMLGKRPYFGKNRKQIRDQILAKQVQVKQEELPDGWSVNSMNFVNRMIQRKPVNRLGSNGIAQIKEHPWFKGFHWEKLLAKQMPAPFIPKKISENNDYLQQISETSEDEVQSENLLLLRRKSVQELFEGYAHYVKQPAKKKTNLSTTNNTYTSDEKDPKTRLKKNNFFQ